MRSILHRRGLRFRKDFLIVTRMRSVRADVVFTRQRVAVFIDGCYWHCCPLHGTRPRANADYWVPKLARNVARDLETNRALIVAGWCVVRVWEHEAPADAAAAVVSALQTRRHPSSLEEEGAETSRTVWSRRTRCAG